MKKWILMMLLTVVIIGCGGSKEEVKSDEPKEKVMNMAIFWLDSNIDPIQDWNGWTLNRIGVGENLVQMDENMDIKPVIAESYNQVDDLTTVFNIREGVTFHSGRKVDAEAVKQSIMRVLNESNREDMKFPLDEMVAEGQKLTIKTKTPYPTLINDLTDTVYILVDADAAKEEGFKYKPITTGAFKVMDFDPDKGLTLHKYEGYWKEKSSNIDVVNVRYIQDSSTRAMALQAKEIQFAAQITNRDLELFKNKDEYNVVKGSNLRIFLLRLNFKSDYMNNLEFRKALSYGIDKNTYARELVGGVPAKGPFTQSLSFAYQGDDYYQYDPEMAKKILDDAGFVDTNGDGIRESNGKNITLKYVFKTNHGSDANNTGIAMQQQLKQVGIDLKVTQMESYSDIIKSGEFDMMWERWTSAPTGDSRPFIESGYKTDGAGNYGGYSNPKLDELIKGYETTFEKADRDKIGAEASKILIEDVATLFMYYQEGNIVTTKDMSGIYRFVSEIYYIDDRVMRDYE